MGLADGIQHKDWACQCTDLLSEPHHEANTSEDCTLLHVKEHAFAIMSAGQRENAFHLSYNIAF